MLKGIFRRVGNVLRGRATLDEETIEELEAALVMGDVSAPLAMKIVADLRGRAERERVTDEEGLLGLLRDEMYELLAPWEGELNFAPEPPTTIMMLGVNGVGKTTTIGKLAARASSKGQKVIIAAADTFRAAAVEQLAIWAERSGADIVRHKAGADPAAVAYDAVEAARARGADIVLIDTAGRIHTRVNLMEELKKIKRSIAKAMPDAPHEALLILDATTGQNALSQARMFHESIGVTGLAMTKLDGTAKGGIVVGICNSLKIPIRYIGIGEQIEDLQEFDPERFVEALF